jgi:hypothetical protein
MQPKTWTSRTEALRRLNQVVPLERQCEALKTTICCLRRELENKGGHVARLKFLLSERLNKIDQLNATIDRLREQNRRLDAEAERYAEMVRLS